MASFSPKLMPKEYTPGGTYNFIYSIGNQIPQWNDLELHVLSSNGYDASSPSTYCNTVVFGGSETAVTQVITYNINGAGIVDPIMNNPQIYQDSKVDMAYPVTVMYNGGATRFTSNMVFGQEAGEDYPAKIVVENDSENRTTLIKWYKNNVLVNTDTIAHQIVGSFAIGITASGNTITGYAIIFQTRGSDALWTSGLKSNVDVIDILNQGGDAGNNQDVYGFTDEDMGEFIISKITSANGGDQYTGLLCGGDQDETIASCNEELQTICDKYGWLGTDVICYLTKTESSAEAWNIINNDPSSVDGANFVIPDKMGDGYTRRIIYIAGSGFFYQKLDGDGNVVSSTNIPINSHYQSAGSGIYLTWYKQSKDISQMDYLVAISMMRTSGSWLKPYYRMMSLEAVSVDAEVIDNYGLLLDMIDGYDPGSGQEDDPQDDPDDIDDPAYDPLGSGFLYAFMVDLTDMTNLADALVPETLAEKIRADFGNNLFEFIVSYHMMPCLTNGDSLNKMNIAYRGNPFTYGDNNTPLALAPITTTFYTVSCGSKVCMPSGARQDGFENWAHANVQLYLPFIGYVHLNTADVWNKAVSIYYKFDILQGTCVANVGVGTNGTIYSFEGTCKYSIPFTSAIDKSNTALLSGIMSSVSVAGAIGGVAAGGSPTALLGAVGSVADATGSFLAAAEHKSIINRGGSLSGSPGWLMPRKPALIITVPNRIQPDMIYNDTNGYPTFKTGYLSGYSGNYVEVGQIGLKAVTNSYGASPNDSELDMIKTTLKGGVYV